MRTSLHTIVFFSLEGRLAAKVSDLETRGRDRERRLAGKGEKVGKPNSLVLGCAVGGRAGTEWDLDSPAGYRFQGRTELTKALRSAAQKQNLE